MSCLSLEYKQNQKYFSGHWCYQYILLGSNYLYYIMYVMCECIYLFMYLLIYLDDDDGNIIMNTLVNTKK